MSGRLRAPPSRSSARASSQWPGHVSRFELLRALPRVSFSSYVGGVFGRVEVQHAELAAKVREHGSEFVQRAVIFNHKVAVQGAISHSRVNGNVALNPDGDGQKSLFFRGTQFHAVTNAHNNF